jgi:hypothetical protein
LNELNLEKSLNGSVCPVDPSDITSLKKYTDDGSGMNVVDYMSKLVKLN